MHTTIWLVSSIIMTPPVTRLSVKFGKNEIFLTALAVFARHPLSRRMADDIRAQLAARSKAAA
jgi:Na+/melibiose symporter-like transporter